MPTWLFLACGVVVFFNGQHYAQRVIGDYYIKKKEDHIKRGLKRACGVACELNFCCCCCCCNN